jgi:hypothetical protein
MMDLDPVEVRILGCLIERVLRRHDVPEACG